MLASRWPDSTLMTAWVPTICDVGVTSGSKALIADALHSAANIITAFAIILSQKVSSRPADNRFHYGYGKVEFIAAGAISLLIILGAIALIMVSIKHLMQGSRTTPHFSALLMALISIGANEMMFRYMHCAGTQLKSQTILASAWANRADCFSSIAVIIGVVGGSLGFRHMDPIAALFAVAIMTWGLITNGAEPSGFAAAVLGLLAYLATWVIGLYAVAR